MKISALYKKYKNKWILAEVLKEDKLNKLIEVKPLVVSDKRDKVYESLAKLKTGSHVATIYTGLVPPKGNVFAFYVRG